MDAKQIGAHAISSFKVDIPQTFFYDRNKNNPVVPINGRACRYISELYDYVLQGATEFEIEATSIQLIQILEKASGLPLWKFRIDYEDTGYLRYTKRTTLLSLLDELLLLISNEESIEVSSVRLAFQRVLAVDRTKAAEIAHRINNGLSDIGALRIIRDVSFASFASRLSTTHHKLDVILFDGFEWTSKYRQAIVTLMSKPFLTIRVSLINPASPLLSPLSEFYGIDPESLRIRIPQTIDLWKSMYQGALNSNSTACSLELSFNNGSPFKELYRFDDSIMLVPAMNPLPISQSISYELVFDYATAILPFDVYRQEIDWLFSNGVTVWKASSVL